MTFSTPYRSAKAVKTLFAESGKIEEYLPSELLQKRGLADYSKSLYQMHFPDDFAALTRARQRLVYNEFFDFFLRMQMDAEDKVFAPNTWHFDKEDCYTAVRSKLPFALTAGQEETLATVKTDLHGAYVSQRLIQGDVGSGKTIIAFLLMLLAAENGYQSAIMAPTEVLATQHYETFCEYIAKYELPFSVVLVTGAMKGAARREANARIEKEKS